MPDRSPDAPGEVPEERISRADQVKDLETLLKYAYERKGRALALPALRRLKKVDRPEDRHFELARSLAREDPLLAVPRALLVAVTDGSIPDRLRHFVQRLVARASIPANPALDGTLCPALYAVLDGESELLAEAIEQVRGLDGEHLDRAGLDPKGRVPFEDNVARTLVLFVAQREHWGARRLATELDRLLWVRRSATEPERLASLVDGDRDRALGVLMEFCRSEAAVLRAQLADVRAESERTIELERRATRLAEERARSAEAAVAGAQERYQRAESERDQSLEELRRTRALHDDQRAHANYDFERLRSRTLRQMTTQRRLVAEASEVLHHDPHLVDVIADRLEAVLRSIDQELTHLGNGGSNG